MKHTVDPRQIWLFDPVGTHLSPKTLASLKEDWPGLFRGTILALMPVDAVGSHFDASMGRPSKELYSMCGLILLMEFFGWTAAAAVDQYVFNMKVHYALNLPSDGLELTARTLERYRRLFREDALAERVMGEVTAKLVEMLELSVDKQRLDSTHLSSDMAQWGRTKLMTEVVRRFLAQLKRHEPELCAGLPEGLAERHAKAGGWSLGRGMDADAKRLARQTVAEDMHLLVARFEGVGRVAGRSSFKDMARVFGEQCEVVGGKVSALAKGPSGGLQNPSGPDAAYDGHKGVGYQAQMSQTCDPANPVQLVVGVMVQAANESDAKSLEPMLDRLEEAGHMPETLLADAGYGSDGNVLSAADRGVELVAPALKGGGAGRLGLEDFALDPCGRVLACPSGHAPESSVFDADSERGRATFNPELCAACSAKDKCPAYKHGKKEVVKYGAKELRLAERRKRERGEEFKLKYSPRAGIEPLFGDFKNHYGLGRLGVRGMRAVSMSVFLKVAGHNILRAAKAIAAKGKPTKQGANRAETAIWGANVAPVAAILRGWPTHTTEFAAKWRESSLAAPEPLAA